MLNLGFEKDAFLYLEGIQTGADAKTFLNNRLDCESKVKLRTLKNEMILVKIAGAIAAANPDGVFINRGYNYELEWVKARSRKECTVSIFPKYENSDYYDWDDQPTGFMEDSIMMIGFFSRGTAADQCSIPTVIISNSAEVLRSAGESCRNCYHDFDSEIEKFGQFQIKVYKKGAFGPSCLGHSLFIAAGI